MKQKSVLIQAWVIYKRDSTYFLPYTHWVYLNEITAYFDQICLVSPVIRQGVDVSRLVELNFPNLYVVELPGSETYLGAAKYFLKYVSVFRKLKRFSVAYARYPTPFGWLQRVFLKGTKRIIHYVGDPVEAAERNPNFSRARKIVLKFLFFPEYLLYHWASKEAKIYTNGHHLSEKLKKNGIYATPLISSTLMEDDFFFDENKLIEKSQVKLLYVGYLRKAKGVETVIESYKLIKELHPNTSLSIVGSGEFEEGIRAIIGREHLTDVRFFGHVDHRPSLNHLLRTHDIFCFASLSEGSPRVILEAMANGINVVTTPVGSLPTVFQDRDSIVFAEFNNPRSFCRAYEFLLSNPKEAETIRKKAFVKAQEYTLHKFIKQIFSGD